MKLYIITGETAVGKSKFAIKLAKKINGCIVNGDSQQIIQELPILTDQPNQYYDIDHYLYGYRSYSDDISSYSWCCDVRNLLHNITKPVIIVGGSGFYMRNLIQGHSPIPPISKDINLNMDINAMLALIKQYDQNYKYVDSYRLTRDVAIIKETGKSMNEWMKESNEQFITIKPYLILLKSTKVNDNIEARIYNFFDDAVNEVKRNIEQNLHRIIGFTEISDYLLGRITKQRSIELMIYRTRQYAKRQRTWFRNKMTFDEIIDIN